MNDQSNISGVIYMVLKSRDCVFKMSIFKNVYCTVQCTLVHVYVHIKKLCCRAAVVANRSITPSVLGVSDRWICSIVLHSRHFSSIEVLSAVLCAT